MNWTCEREKSRQKDKEGERGNPYVPIYEFYHE